jgi:PAT family beta-lactamase induction signal transducer AmpG
MEAIHLNYRLLALAFIGFANALPMPLMGNVLSIWLSEAGYTKDLIGAFALAGLPLSFKLLWAPVVDYVSPPCFAGQQRKGWLILSILAMALATFSIGCVNPATSPWLLAISIFALALATSCLCICGIAYELESIDDSSYGMGSAYVVTGYRLGLLCAGAGGLYLSSFLNWSAMFHIMALLLLLGTLIIWLQPEPYRSAQILEEKKEKLATYSSPWWGFWQESFLTPFRSFISNPSWKIILVFIVFFKVGDELMRSMIGPFYLSIGFDKIDIANAEKVWGMAATICGAFLMAILLKNRDLYDCTIKIGVLHAFTLICYVIMASVGKSYLCLYSTIALENLTGGMAMTAFIALLWRVCDRGHAAIQYLLLWSLYLFKGRLFGTLGGILAENCSWFVFFSLIATIAMGSAISMLALRNQQVVRQKAIL